MAFKCTRKRFVIETLHLDVEGGVGERRTSAPNSAHGAGATLGEAPHQHQHPQSSAQATVSIAIEENPSLPNTTLAASGRFADPTPLSASTGTSSISFEEGTEANEKGLKKKPLKSAMKKRVAFGGGDRPELYDF